MEPATTSALGLIVLVSAVLFLLYRTGVIKLAQTTSDSAIAQAAKSMELWELDSDEARSRKYGKLIAKLEDKNIHRSSASVVRARLEALAVVTKPADKD